MKRLFLFLIFAVLCGGYAMAYDFSAVCETGQTLYYNITSDTVPYTVEVIRENTSSPYYTTYPIGNLAIPSSVTNSDITYSVTSIGNGAFRECRGLTSVTIPNSVTSIGVGAFYGCSGLEEITIPFVGNSATATTSSASVLFGYIFGANSYSGGIRVEQYYGSYNSTDYYIPNGLRSVVVTGGNLLYGAFYGCSMLTSVTISNSVTSIGSYAFSGCSGLTSVTIPESVSIINNGTFRGCSGLTDVTIPNSVTRIDGRAFADCSSLTSVTIGNGVTLIRGSDTFENCSGLTAVYYTGTIAQWCGITFENNSGNPLSFAHNLYIDNNLVVDLVIPDTVAEIKANAFSGALCLTSVTIPSSVTAIGNGAFRGCSGLTEITIPNSVTSIGGDAFNGCCGLTAVTIPRSVTSIGESAFYGCSGLTAVNYNATTCNMGSSSYPVFANCNANATINIGSNVTKIPAYAFNGLLGSGALTIPDSTTYIGNNAFQNCSGFSELSIGVSVYWIGNSAFGGCIGLGTVNYNATSCSLSDNNGISGNTSITTLSIGDNVVSIPNSAFVGCSGIIGALTIPNSVTRIGQHAFEGCSGLTSITIGEGVTNISDGVFKNCSGLTELSLGESVATIGNSAFYGCSGLSGMLTIPNSVTSISESAFYNCGGLTSVTIGNSVESIGNNAFYGCSRLTAVNFNATNCTTMGSSSYPVFQDCNANAIINIGGNVITIPDCAFKGLLGNGTLAVPDSVLSIGESAFYNCNRLTEVLIGNSVVSIANSAFYGCSRLSGTLTIPNIVTNIGNSAFSNCSGLSGLSIGESVANIGNSAFSGCNNITTLNYNAINCTNLGSNNNITGNTNIATLTIGENVETIPNDAFSGCSGLSGTLTIPNSTTSIGESAFYNCSGLTSVVTGESLASIGASAFEGCSAIRTMTLGSNVATIGNRAFAGCTGLFMATVKPELPPMAQAETFENVSTTAVIKVPCGSVPYYNAAQYWNVFTNVQGDMVYALTVGSSDDIMGYATVTQVPTCTNLTGIITATANNGYRFVSWNDGNTANPRTVTLTSDVHYIANFESLYPTVYNSFTAEACGSYTWNEQTYTTSGEYQQTFTAVSSADSIVTLSLTIYPMPQPEITASGVLDGCNPSPITLSAGDYSAYNWSTGANTATISISEPGYYYVEVTDAHGCTGISEQINIGLSNALTEAPQISVVGMNSENRNVVAWSALDNANVNAYRIYRENNVANVYEPMATVEALQTTWTDSTADPTARAYRYKVTAVDECGGESPMSDYHKTMHLTINQGIGNTWNLIWSHYEGFNFGTYRIYRGTSPSNMTMIGEVPSNLNSYTDNTATASTGYYYQVEVVRNSRSRDAEISSRSNIVDNGIFPEYTITVMSANPNRGTVTGGGTYPEGTVITIEAIANEGFEFASWSDENTDNPRQITVTADATYIATFDPATGIEETSALEIALFPNPANDILNISSSETISEIEIVNVTGQVVRRIEVNSDNAVCDVEELKTGVYIVRIHGFEMASVICQRKFIKE